MRRFDWQDDDYEEEGEEEEDYSVDYITSPEEYQNILDSELAIYETKIVHEEIKRKMEILNNSISFLKNSFFWKFFPLKTKLNYIDLIFNKFNDLVENNVQEEEEEE